MQIKIHDGLADVTYKKNKKWYTKVITVASLIASMVSEHGIRTPLLPLGTRFYVRRDNIHILYLEIPAQTRYIKYVNRSNKVIFEGAIPLPWAIMKIQVAEGSDGKFHIEGNSWIYALKRPLISMTDQLYHFPVPNIHSDQHICWGGTFSGDNSKFNNLAEVGRVIDLYFSSQFNTDIPPRISYYERYEDFCRENKDKRVFNPEWLSPIGNSFNQVV